MIYKRPTILEELADSFGVKPFDKTIENIPLIPDAKSSLIRTAEEIALTPCDQISFLHSILCQVGMPKNETDELFFERRNGQACIRLQAGHMLHPDGKFVQQPLPSGSKPRLIMIHISSEAVKRKTRVIEVGHSAREFLMTLDINVGGRSYNYFKKQMLALAACRMTLGLFNGIKSITINTEPISKFEAWLSNNDKQSTLWPGILELSNEFYSTLIEHAVPLDSRALGELKGSALKLDIYTWLAYRLCRIDNQNGITISWEKLREQFGQEFKHPYHFKAEFIKSLKAVTLVYKKAKIELIDNGIILKPSLPPIPKTTILLN